MNLFGFLKISKKKRQEKIEDNVPKCFGNSRQNRIKLGEEHVHRICKSCRYYNKCCEKIINGNGYITIIRKETKKEFEGYKENGILNVTLD